MAAELAQQYQEAIRAKAARADELPAELVALNARIARLRDRLRTGDPDMTADEIQAAIDRQEAKRRELIAAQPAAGSKPRALAGLPKAAELYRRQIADGLDGDPRAAMKARVIFARVVRRENPPCP